MGYSTDTWTRIPTGVLSGALLLALVAGCVEFPDKRPAVAFPEWDSASAPVTSSDVRGPEDTATAADPEVTPAPDASAPGDTSDRSDTVAESGDIAPAGADTAPGADSGPPDVPTVTDAAALDVAGAAGDVAATDSGPVASDASAPADAVANSDASAPPDTAAGLDAGAALDVGSAPDAGAAPDVGLGGADAALPCPSGCLHAPEPACLDSATLRLFQAPGTCLSGGCAFAWVDVPCAHGCALGGCAPGPCDGGEGSACDDGDPCTTGDACQSGECVGAADPCDDGLACTTDACSGGCTHVPVDAACDDGDPCTQDRCDGAAGCVAPVRPDGSVCGAGPDCGPDVCQSGLCVASCGPFSQPPVWLHEVSGDKTYSPNSPDGSAPLDELLDWTDDGQVRVSGIGTGHAWEARFDAPAGGTVSGVEVVLALRREKGAKGDIQVEVTDGVDVLATAVVGIDGLTTSKTNPSTTVVALPLDGAAASTVGTLRVRLWQLQGGNWKDVFWTWARVEGTAAL